MVFLKVGLVKKPHGLKGELKILTLTDDGKRFKQIKTLYTIDDSGNQVGEYGMSNVRVAADEIVAKLVGVDSIDAAELLRGKYLYIDRECGVGLDEWEFYTQDIIGLDVVYQGKKVGTVDDVVNSGANDNLVVSIGHGKTVFYPFVRTFIDEVNKDKKIVVINEYEGFFDL